MVVEFECRLDSTPTRLTHAWERMVGSGRALLALRADWQEQLRRAHRELGFRQVRFHGLLDDDMGTLICHDQRPLHSFFNLDSVFDFLLSIGMRPFAELSFMPWSLASGATTVFRYRGNVTPPRDHGDWAALIERLVRHWVDRYGAREVTQWCLEVWNEPNLEAFWTGGREGYYELYRVTAEAIKAIDPGLLVGGPASAQNAWIPEFLAHCDAYGVPVDFVSTHYYPTDAFGQIGADTLTQLEHAPRDVMRKRAEEARSEARGLPLYYTEWNVSSNPRDPLHDEPFAAAFAADIALSVDELVTGYSFWTFTDIFDEDYFPSAPFHGGFGLLSLHGVPKPVYRAFELLHRLGDHLCAVSGDHDTVSVRVSRKNRTVSLFLTNYALPRHEIDTEIVRVRLPGAARPRSALLARIDADHCNPRRAWEELGEPEYLSPRQLEALQASATLAWVPHPVRSDEGGMTVDIVMPPQSVAALEIEQVER